MQTELVTDRGDRLRRWRPEDAPGVFAAFEDPSMDHQIGEPLVDVADAERWIGERNAHWDAGTAYSWVVVDAGGGVLASVTVSSVERRHLIGWISYWTAPPARGRGVASSALRAVATWAFDELGLFRLELGHRVDNPASRGVAVGAGFVSEGFERQKLRYGDERFDVETHARLATDPVPG